MMPTAEQLADWLASAERSERVGFASAFLAAADTAGHCERADHEHFIEELQRRLVRAEDAADYARDRLVHERELRFSIVRAFGVPA